jgi:hypothetical protein
MDVTLQRLGSQPTVVVVVVVVVVGGIQKERRAIGADSFIDCSMSL